MDSALITGIVAAMGAFPVAWLLSGRYMRRKIKADATGAELDNAKKVVDLFEKLSEGQNREISKLREELGEVKKELVLLKLNACYEIDCPKRKTRKL